MWWNRAIPTLIQTKVSAIDEIGMIARLARKTVDFISASMLGSEASRRSLIQTSGIVLGDFVIALFFRREHSVRIIRQHSGITAKFFLLFTTVLAGFDISTSKSIITFGCIL